MTTVWEVANEAKPGDQMKWKGEQAGDITPKANTVTRVVLEMEKITVEGEGPRGADVSFWVKRDGTSKVLHQGNGQGAVDCVELPDKGIETRHFSE
jgi:hypothetical protein